MAIKKKIPIKYSKARVILSDVLPYETPLTFSNRHFYNFINNNKINFKYFEKGSQIEFSTGDKNLERIINIIFDSDLNDKNQIEVKNERKIPFSYKIRHKNKDFRELSLPHPKSQLELIQFYDQYKELILYYSKQSPFSIRRPDAVAKYIFVNDELHKKQMGDKEDFLEDSEREYESLKTFFTYKKYPNIYKFYEHYRYHRAEKKYNKLYKFDIAQCFDSIYTHSIAWAIYSKEYIKKNLKGHSKQDFANYFDTLMQNANYGETNGIMIGPEISRIFAEIILQQIDKRVEKNLRYGNWINKETPLLFKTDYEIYRYVDDYFVFYNDEQTKDRILEEFKINLKEFKLSISESKSKLYEKPLITELTIAKNKIIDLFESDLGFKIEDKVIDEKDKPSNITETITLKCNSNNLIVKFKTIIKESNVEYKDIMNFTLALINNRVEKYLKKFEEFHNKFLNKSILFKIDSMEAYQIPSDEVYNIKIQERFTKFLINLLDFTFFIYAVDPRVNFSIKICHIISQIKTIYSERIRFFTGKYINEDTKTRKIYAPRYNRFEKFNKSHLYKKISDEIILIFDKYKAHNHVQIEILFLITAHSQLGKEYRISENKLIKYFNLDNNGTIECNVNMNYFVLTTILFYIKNCSEFNSVKQSIKNCIIQKIESEKNRRTTRTEIVLLFLDTLVCPYLDNKFKRKLMRLFDIQIRKEQDKIFEFKKTQKYWFTKWDNFNFAKEIEAKIAQEPY